MYGKMILINLNRKCCRNILEHFMDKNQWFSIEWRLLGKFHVETDVPGYIDLILVDTDQECI